LIDYFVSSLGSRPIGQSNSGVNLRKKPHSLKICPFPNLFVGCSKPTSWDYHHNMDKRSWWRWDL